MSYFAVWHFFEHEGISFKKSPHASEQNRPNIARRRAYLKKYQGRLDPTRLVFIDETWAKINMTRTHGRCARGRRLMGKAPHGRWRTVTFLAALRHDQIVAPCVFDGPINGRNFLAYVEQCLAPELSPGDVVIMDNLGSHKSQAARRAIRKTGAKLFFLPDVIDGSGAGALDEDLGTAIRAALRVPRELCRKHALAYSWRRSAEQFLDNLRPFA